MKNTRRVLALVATLLITCGLHAADPKNNTRVLSLLEVDTDDSVAYATWIAKYNEIAKAKLGVDNYLRVFQAMHDGRANARVRVATTAPNMVELDKRRRTLENDPGIRDLMDRMRGIRKLGPRVLYQGIYSDALTPRNGYTYTTVANITDEAAYLKALGELRAIFDSIGLKDVTINAYRIMAGRTDHTHRITIGAPSSERLAVFLDAGATNSKLQEWIANTGKIRTVVSNFTARDITK